MNKEQFQELQQIYLESCEDRIRTSSEHIESIANNEGNVEESLKVIRRDLHSMKGMGTASGFPGITAIAHRAEEFILHNETLNTQEISDLYKFYDAIQTLMVKETQPNSDEIAEMVRNLPHRNNETEKKNTNKAIEVLSVMPPNLVHNAINDDLRELGFRLSNIPSGIEAIRTILHTKPDLIVLSAVIDEIDGIELSKILRLIENTKNIPIILITSFDNETLLKKDLPKDVKIIKKGKNFLKNISETLTELRVI